MDEKEKKRSVGLHVRLLVTTKAALPTPVCRAGGEDRQKEQGKCDLWTFRFVQSGLKKSNVQLIFLKIKSAGKALHTVSAGLGRAFLCLSFCRSERNKEGWSGSTCERLQRRV